MRYIGGKSLLLDFLDEAITGYTNGVQSVTDIFSGSGVVSAHFKSRGYNVVSNDILYFSYILSRGTVGLSKKTEFKNLGIGDPIDFLNNLQLEDTKYTKSQLFITENYSPGDSCNRMYFQRKNAVKIDIIRLTIEDWFSSGKIDEDEYFYLLAILLNAVPYVSNITGVYAAYLKFWDIRTYNDLQLEHLPLMDGVPSRCLNVDYRDCLNERTDLLYADPPYNEREYLSNYHILETIARYDYPVISGITGMRRNENGKSPFCSKKTVYQAFYDLIAGANSRYILISYNNEGLLPSAALAELCSTFAIPGSFHILERPYRRYKNKIPNNREGLYEQLFLFEKR